MTDQATLADRVGFSRDGHVAVLTLNRPDKLNAIDEALLLALDQRLGEVEAASPPIRAVVLTGAGRAFAAGADIAAMAELSAAEAQRFAALGQRVFARLEALPMPVIAAVGGHALGGGSELALACDFIFASEKATLGQPEVSLGVTPGFGGTARLARRVGIARARQLVYTGERLKAADAKAMGLVNEVFEPEALLEGAMQTARLIASKGPLAVAAAKRVLRLGEGASLEAACALEAEAFGALFGNHDQREGMRAFLDKRSAQFLGS